jgi:hypothetical protein
MNEARVLADLVFPRDPNCVQHYRRTWGSHSFRHSGTTAHYVIDQEPVYLGLDSQLELNAQRLYNQRLFDFTLRPAIHEGDVAAAVPINIRHVVHDPVTGEESYPNEAIVAAFRSLLQEKSGVPLKTLLAEQDALLLPAPATQSAGRQIPQRHQRQHATPQRSQGTGDSTPQNTGGNHQSGTTTDETPLVPSGRQRHRRHRLA